MEKYSSDVGQKMKDFYNTLSEKHKRRYAAIEAFKLGHGGIVHISNLLGCSRNTAAKGIKELKGKNNSISDNGQIRKPGGGRKTYEYHITDIDEKFLNILKNYTAGDPMNKDILWTNLTKKEIANLLLEKHHIRVSKTVVSKLLKKHNYRRRKIQKKQTMKEVVNRNEQFENIAHIILEYEKENQPIISIDTKKKNI